MHREALGFIDGEFGCIIYQGRGGAYKEALVRREIALWAARSSNNITLYKTFHIYIRVLH